MNELNDFTKQLDALIEDLTKAAAEKEGISFEEMEKRADAQMERLKELLAQGDPLPLAVHKARQEIPLDKPLPQPRPTLSDDEWRNLNDQADAWSEVFNALTEAHGPQWLHLEETPMKSAVEAIRQMHEVSRIKEIASHDNQPTVMFTECEYFVGSEQCSPYTAVKGIANGAGPDNKIKAGVDYYLVPKDKV